MPRARFSTPDLCCSSEAEAARRELGALEGVGEIHVDLVGRRIFVDYDEAVRQESDLATALRAAGLPPSEEGEGRAGWIERHARTLTIFSAAATAATLAALWIPGVGIPWAVAACLVAVAAGGATFARPAWQSLRALRPDMNLLMSMAILAALAIGEWGEAAAVAFLFALAEELERASMERAHRSVESLLDLEPVEARWLRPDGAEERVPVEEVHPGQRIRVRAGERMPLDGLVESGSSTADEAPLTGESVPVTKGPGDEVFAGTVNGPGLLEIEVTRRAGDSTLDRVLRLVEQARASTGPSQRFVDRFARLWTPGVLALAALVLVLPPLLLDGSWGTWFYRSLVLLVVSCPCALVLSTPVTVVSALTAAARTGVLVKGGRHLEEAGRVRAIAFDKTGTLTEGGIHVVETGVAPEVDPTVFERTFLALERHASHPVGEAVARHLEERISDGGRRKKDLHPTDLRVIPGLGVEGRVEGVPALAGSPRLLEERGVGLAPIREDLETQAEAGRTVAVVAADGEVLGWAALEDRVRPEARGAVGALRAAGIEPIVMLTGDHEGPAEAVGRAVGVDRIRSRLLPEDKLRAVRELRDEIPHAAMVGDGVNDAPALAAASLGIALGTGGTAAAIESADVAIVGDRLDRIPWLLRLGRRAGRVIRFNIAAALLVKAVFVVLAVTGHATLWMAVAADMGASLLVIANGMRLLGGDGEGREERRP